MERHSPPANRKPWALCTPFGDTKIEIRLTELVQFFFKEGPKRTKRRLAQDFVLFAAAQIEKEINKVHGSNRLPKKPDRPRNQSRRINRIPRVEGSPQVFEAEIVESETQKENGRTPEGGI